MDIRSDIHNPGLTRAHRPEIQASKQAKQPFGGVSVFFFRLSYLSPLWLLHLWAGFYPSATPVKIKASFYCFSHSRDSFREAITPASDLWEPSYFSTVVHIKIFKNFADIVTLGSRRLFSNKSAANFPSIRTVFKGAKKLILHITKGRYLSFPQNGDFEEILLLSLRHHWNLLRRTAFRYQHTFQVLRLYMPVQGPLETIFGLLWRTNF